MTSHTRASEGTGKEAGMDGTFSIFPHRASLSHTPNLHSLGLRSKVTTILRMFVGRCACGRGVCVCCRYTCVNRCAHVCMAIHMGTLQDIRRRCQVSFTLTLPYSPETVPP